MSYHRTYKQHPTTAYWTVCKSSLTTTSPHGPLTRYAKLRVAHAPGMPGTISPPPRVSDPDMHHGTCVTHVPWCMPGSLTSCFLWSRCQGKRSRHPWRIRNPQFCVSGKRTMLVGDTYTGDFNRCLSSHIVNKKRYPCSKNQTSLVHILLKPTLGTPKQLQDLTRAGEVVNPTQIGHTKATKSLTLSWEPPTAYQHCGHTLIIEHTPLDCTALQQNEYYTADLLRTPSLR